MGGLQRLLGGPALEPKFTQKEKIHLLRFKLRKRGFKNHRAVSRNIQKLHWQARLSTGFNSAGVAIPKRFTEVTTWKGKVDGELLEGLKNAYARRILELGAEGAGLKA